MIESFTIAEAAEAIGRNELTFRRWVDRDMVPAPYLVDKNSRAKLYSKGELEVIARILARHSVEFQNLCETHAHVIHTMHQHMQAYRTHYV